ncbi:MAG TPA: nucleotide exchange factor GrpE [Candidatus Sulfotelmatobacter sp.]|nr:nucleotide exchange factor GrpE [Candidatus Sulfotelmatobacter sp.]
MTDGNQANGASETPAETTVSGEGEAAAPDLAEALKAKSQELERLQERLLRLQAEFDNTKKRVAREKAEFLKFANEDLLLRLLPVLDNLERALASAPPDRASASLREGVEMTARLFRSTLEKVGVRPVEALGQPFDPTLHQAVAQVESPAGEENLVIEEIQKGYLLEGRVLRPAMVKVSRAIARREPAGTEESTA